MILERQWPDLRLRDFGSRVALLELDVAGQPMNVMTPALIDQLDEVVDNVAASGVRGVVVASAKPSGFMAGADLKSMPTMFGQDIPADGVDGVSKAELVFEKNFRFNRVLRRLESGSATWVCAINGVALGGGLELAMACHARVVSDTRQVRLGLPEVSVGLMPGAGGTQRLPRLAGAELALDLLLTGRAISAQEALAAGIVDAVVAPDQLIERAAALAAEISPLQPWDVLEGSSDDVAAAVDKARRRAERGDGRRYNAPWTIIDAVERGLASTFDEALRIETRAFAELVMKPQAEAMIDALFVDRRGMERSLGRPDLSVLARVLVAGRGKPPRELGQALARAGVVVDKLAPTTVDAPAETGVGEADGERPTLLLVGRDGQRDASVRDGGDRVPRIAVIDEHDVRTAPPGIVELRLGTPRHGGRLVEIRTNGAKAGDVEAARAVAAKLRAIPLMHDGSGGSFLGSRGMTPAPSSEGGTDLEGLEAQRDAARRALRAGIVADERTGNVAAIFGWGFPAWTGGPFRDVPSEVA